MATTVSTDRFYGLRHIERGEFICLLYDGVDYIAAFSDGDTAHEFRAELGLIEHVDILPLTLDNCPFGHLWLDGERIILEKEEQ
jgi:hypothetical protein